MKLIGLSADPCGMILGMSIWNNSAWRCGAATGSDWRWQQSMALPKACQKLQSLVSRISVKKLIFRWTVLAFNTNHLVLVIFHASGEAFECFVEDTLKKAISSLMLIFNESGEVSLRFETEPCLSIFTLCGCVCELLNTWSLSCVTWTSIYVCRCICSFTYNKALVAV